MQHSRPRWAGYFYAPYMGYAGWRVSAAFPHHRGCDEKAVSEHRRGDVTCYVYAGYAEKGRQGPIVLASPVHKALPAQWLQPAQPHAEGQGQSLIPITLIDTTTYMFGNYWSNPYI